MNKSVMNSGRHRQLVQLAAGLAVGVASMTQTAHAQSSFVYQGLLEDGGAQVNTPVALQFRLFTAQTGGTQRGGTISQTITPENGLFSTELNFGTGAFVETAALWLEITVDGTPLPRQKITAAPYAMNTRGITVDSSGNVGIGLDPARSFEVDLGPDNGTIGYGNGFDAIFDGGDDGRFDFVNSGGLSGETRFLRFGNDTPLLTIENNGNLGVGTGAPLSKFVVDSAQPIRGQFEMFTTNGGDFRYDGGSDGDFFIEHSGDSTGSTIFGRTGGQRLLKIQNDGRVGVGTDSPAFPLSVASDASGNTVGVTSTVGGSGYHLDFNGGSLSVLESGDKIRMTFLDDDRISIGSGFGFTNVGVNINLPFAFGLNLQQGDAGKPGGGSWANTSDVRLKKNIEPLEDALGTLLKLKGVHYEYKDPEAIGELTGVRTGFIAQEVEEVIPDWVWEAGDGYKRVTIRGFEALAVEALREQQAQIDQLRAELDAVKSGTPIARSSIVWPAALGIAVFGGLAVSRRKASRA